MTIQALPYVTGWSNDGRCDMYRAAVTLCEKYVKFLRDDPLGRRNLDPAPETGTTCRLDDRRIVIEGELEKNVRWAGRRWGRKFCSKRRSWASS